MNKDLWWWEQRRDSAQQMANIGSQCSFNAGGVEEREKVRRRTDSWESAGFSQPEWTVSARTTIYRASEETADTRNKYLIYSMFSKFSLIVDSTPSQSDEGQRSHQWASETFSEATVWNDDDIKSCEITGSVFLPDASGAQPAALGPHSALWSINKSSMKLSLNHPFQIQSGIF